MAEQEGVGRGVSGGSGPVVVVVGGWLPNVVVVDAVVGCGLSVVADGSELSVGG